MKMTKDKTCLTRWGLEGDLIVPEDWDYASSIKRCKNLFKEVREKGAAAVIEIAIAHKALTDKTKHKGSAKFKGKTFKHYCGEVGIHPDTARKWLKAYFPPYYRDHIEYERYETEKSLSKSYEKYPKEWRENDLDELDEDPQFRREQQDYFMRRLTLKMNKITSDLIAAVDFEIFGDWEDLTTTAIKDLHKALWPFYNHCQKPPPPGSHN